MKTGFFSAADIDCNFTVTRVSDVTKRSQHPFASAVHHYPPTAISVILAKPFMWTLLWTWSEKWWHKGRNKQPKAVGARSLLLAWVVTDTDLKFIWNDSYICISVCWLKLSSYCCLYRLHLYEIKIHPECCTGQSQNTNPGTTWVLVSVSYLLSISTPVWTSSEHPSFDLMSAFNLHTSRINAG